jgi:ribosomal protein S18 acetylase RimI-like enzyme
MLSIKPVQSSDYPLLFSLAQEIWKLHYTPIIGEAQVNYMLHKMYSPTGLEKQSHEGQEFLFIYLNQDCMGFLGLSHKDGGFIHKFYIHPKVQGQGLGKHVFNLIIAHLAQPQTITLTVNRENFKSINFYFKLGFKITEVANFDIGEGYLMNDFVMQWRQDGKRAAAQ